MNIIVVSDGPGQTRSYRLTQLHIGLIFGGILLLGFLLSFVTYGLTLRFAADIQNPFVQSLVSSLQREQVRAQEAQMRENLTGLAKKVGELQARLVRLDAFGERLAKAANVKTTEFRFSEAPGIGGPLPSLSLQKDLSPEEFEQILSSLSKVFDDRSDKLGALDSLLLSTRLELKTIPTTLPVAAAYSSNYGYRIDPFTGRSTFHAGIDFTAPTGTPVVAAAGGKVVAAQWHGDYGNVIDIDHNNGIVTRYAHLSASGVKEGEIVQKGQTIGAVGSTGRSTGPHLHFEVRENDVPLNPGRFLALSRE
jgi:murein DD-endopeptidase MepM/ murein hydrolase activator NlpD